MEKLQVLIARCLPRWLVRRAAVRLIEHATAGRHGATLVSRLRVTTALKRWDAKA